MEHTEVIANLLVEWAHVESTILEIEEVPGEGCKIYFENGTEISLEWAGLRGGFGLTSSIGRPPIDRKFVVYETVLCFNALARQNSGARIGLLGPEGDLAMELDFPPRQPDRAGLEALITGFARISHIWRTYVEDTAESLQIPNHAFMFENRA